jgi:tetratricopeptide (TPR) repeat protein
MITLRAALAASLTLLAAHASASDALNAGDLAAALVDREHRFTPDDPDGARRALRDAMAREPKVATWPLALGILEMRTGDAKAARPLLEKAAGLDPNNPVALTWHANSLFATIQDAGLLAKGRMAGDARDALLKAVQIDPAYIDARIALVEFYRNAPGIAGGSKKKAKEHAEALLAQPGDGPFHAHRLLASIAMQEGEWDAADRHFALAAEATDDEDTRRRIALARAYSMLNDRKDAAAALPLARQVYEASGDEADVATLYVYGRALAETGEHAAAAPLLARVLDETPDSKQTRLVYAECLAKQGRKTEAIAQYEEFLKRHPKDDNAGKAKKAIRELQKRG